MHYKQKALSLLLAAAMVLSLVPAAALAAEANPVSPVEGSTNSSLITAFADLEQTAYEVENGEAAPALPEAVTATVGGAETTVAVTWTSEPVFDATVAGDYVFTASAEGNTLDETAQWPTVTVKVKAAAPTEEPVTEAEPTDSGVETMATDATVTWNSSTAPADIDASANAVTVTVDGNVNCGSIVVKGGNNVTIQGDGNDTLTANGSFENGMIVVGEGGSSGAKFTGILTLKDLTLDAGTVSGLSALLVNWGVSTGNGSPDATIVLDNVTFKTNSSTQGTLTVTSGTGLTLKNVTFDGGMVTLGVNTTVEASATLKGTVTLSGGGSLKRASSFSGTMLAVPTDANVTLDGLTVDGGAVYASTENTAEGMGASSNGGTGHIAATAPMITVASGATLNVTGSTLEKNDYNSATSTGGAIKNSGGTVTLTDSAILYCRVQTSGSAIWSAGGTVTLKNSKLEHNACMSSQGTLYLQASATATMEGGSISDNYAKHMAPGVYLNASEGSFTLTSGTISNNVSETSSAIGGGVCVGTGTFTMNGGTISRNTATKGGGIFVVGGTVNLNKGTIESNHGAAVSGGFSGGGITVMGGTVTIGDGNLNDTAPDVLIQGNDAFDGAGVMVGNSSSAAEATVTIQKDVKISGNTGTFGSGVYVAGKADTPGKPVVTLDGAVVTGNQSGQNGSLTGGAVMLLQGGVLNLKGATQITGNTNTAEGVTGEHNLLLHVAGTHATLPAALTAGAHIGVSVGGAVLHQKNTVIATGTRGGTDNADSIADAAASAQYFHDDAADPLTIVASGANVVFGEPGGTLDDVYVASTGDDTTGTGAADHPVATLAKAYELVKTNGTIHVLSNLETADLVTFDANKAITVHSATSTGDEASTRYSVKYTGSASNGAGNDASTYQALLTVKAGKVTLTNLELNANQQKICTAETFGGTLVLGEKALITGAKGTADNRVAGGLFVYSGTATMESGSEISGNEANWGSAVTLGFRGDAAGTGVLTMKDGATIKNNKSTYSGSNNDGGVICGWGGRMVMTGGTITGNETTGCGGAMQIFTKANGDDGTAANATLTITGGTITGNKAARNGGAINATGGTTIVVGGNPVIFGNTETDGTTASNVYLGAGQVLTVANTHLTSGENGAKIGVFTAAPITSGANGDVKIVKEANQTDRACFISDNASDAGIILCGGPATTDSEGNEVPHSDTPVTTEGHTPEANTLWLSKDARQVADIAAGVDGDGKLTLTAKDLDPNKVYTILDKDGVAQNVTLATGTAGANGWFKPDASGTLAFTGLDPANAPYQLIAADNDTTAPDGNASSTTNALVGGAVKAYYVAGAAGTGWAAGDDAANGTRATPYETLTKAYGELYKDGASAGIIIVLSSIEQENTLTFKPTTGAVILGEPHNPSATIQRSASATDNSLYGLFDVYGSSVTFYNLILDGGWDGSTANQGINGALSVRNQGELTLKTCQVKSFSVNGNADAGWDKCVINATGGKLTLDWCYVHGNENARNGWPILRGGDITMKNGSKIVNNKTTISYAVDNFTTLTLADKAAISGNTNNSGAANLYLPDGKTVNAGGLTAGSQIGVTGGMPPAVGADQSVTGDTALTKYFFSDEPAKYGVKLGADGKVYLGVDAKMTVTDGGSGSIVVSPADKDKDYWAVPSPSGDPVKGVYDPATGTVTIKPLNPEANYTVVSVPKDTAQSDVSGNGGMGIITPPAKPATAPNKDGGYATAPDGAAGESKREPNVGATDKITIKGEENYSYAVRVKNDDGTYTYYKQSDGENDPAGTPVWADGVGPHVFDDLPFGLDYEIVKVKTANKGNTAAVPAVTEVPTLPPTVGENDIATAIQDNGKASITVNPTDNDYNYILVGPDGKTVEAVKPGNGGSVTFPDLIPGANYKVLTQKKDADPAIQVGDDLTGKLDRATAVTTPATNKDNVTAEIAGNKVTITVDPADKDSKYAVVDGSGNVVTANGNGWKTPTDGKVVFTDLTPNTSYSVIVVPGTTDNPGTTGMGSTPGAVQIHTPEGSITAPAEGEVTTTSNSITINPTVDGLEYNLMDKDGNIVKAWTPGDGGSLTFTGLSASTQYTVLVRNPNGGNPSVPVKGPAATTQSGGGSSGGGGGGSSTSTSSKVEKTENGKVKVDKPSANAGQTVTITVTPDPGYELDSLVVTDKKGNELELKDLGNGKYSFVMPKDKPVKITTTFKETGATGDPETNGVAKLLIVDDHIAFMKGDDVGNFRPNGSITRAETAQLFYNLLKDKNVTGSKAFADVSGDAWYAKAVLALANLGIVEGVGEGMFEPDRAISRAEFVTVAMRFATNVTGSKTFTDVDEDYWAHGYITGAAYYNWINGYEDGSFKPTNPIARAEAATVVNNMLNREGDKAFIDKAEDLKLFPDVTKEYWAFYEIVEATNAHDFTRDKDGVENWK